MGAESNPEDFKLSIKRRNLKGRIKICPRCFTRVHQVGELSGWLVPAEYFCENCGYRGHVAFEPVPQEDEKLSKEGEQGSSADLGDSPTS